MCQVSGEEITGTDRRARLNVDQAELREVVLEEEPLAGFSASLATSKKVRPDLEIGTLLMTMFVSDAARRYENHGKESSDKNRTTKTRMSRPRGRFWHLFLVVCRTSGRSGLRILHIFGHASGRGAFDGQQCALRGEASAVAARSAGRHDAVAGDED